MKNCCKTIFVMIFAVCVFSLNGQHLNFGLSIGNSHYFGDIQKSNSFSISPSNLAFCCYIGVDVKNGILLKSTYTHSTIEGKDHILKTNRNLSFRSKINEFALTLDIEPLKLFYKNASIKLQPYVSLGYSCILFDPQANIDNDWVRLNPLSTEGQGLPGSNIPEYNLISFTTIVGAGLKYHINNNISLNISINSHQAKTDYLDDVSGTYFNLSDIAKYKGELAAKLSYRTSEIIPEDTEPTNGSLRGNPKNNDLFLQSMVGVNFRF